jgi:hypothetical protein
MSISVGFSSSIDIVVTNILLDVGVNSFLVVVIGD